ncbi:MAG: ATPase domain-containing protein [Candidatus Baldrarchaeia archaeon]
MSLTKNENKNSVLLTGNGELDNKLGGGIPLGSLTLIEGPNDSGKSVFTWQLIWGGLRQGYTITLYTTENTVKSLLEHMKSVSLDVTEYFIWGYFKIIPLQTEEGVEWNSKYTKLVLEALINHIKESRVKVAIIDSLTVFLTHATVKDILNFFTGCKKLCDEGKTILVTIHTYALEEDLLIRVRSICDGHLKFQIKTLRDKVIRMMEVAKIRGAQQTTGNIISFEVDPAFGFKIMPLGQAKA